MAVGLIAGAQFAVLPAAQAADVASTETGSAAAALSGLAVSTPAPTPSDSPTADPGTPTPDPTTPSPTPTKEETSAPPATETPDPTTSPTSEPTDTPTPEPTDTPKSNPKARSLEITPLAAATAAATVRVNKQVLRSDTGTPAERQAYLTGATFQLQTSASGNQIAFAGATCTIPANQAYCDITVPANQIPNNTTSFYVKETTAASGTFALGQIATGTATGSLTAQPYPGSTGNLPTDGGTVNVPRTSVSGNDNLNSIGVTTNSIVNKTLVPTCTALSIGLVLDTSGSIDSNERVSYAAAMKNLINSLPGTTTIKTITFNTTGTFRSALSGSASTSLADAMSTYLLAGSNYANATNWDNALRLAATDSNFNGVDVVLVVTDGAPTTSGNGASVGNVTFANVENAVLSSNAVKQTRNIPVWGVGVALPGGSETNLKAISGPNLNEDYFTANWTELTTTLDQIAKSLTCQVPLTVNKTTIDANNNTVTKAGGWNFTAAATGSGTLSASTPANGTTTSGNSVAWTHQFTATGQTATVTFTENPTSQQTQDGWTFTGVTCTGASPVHVDGTKIWSVSFGLGANISCTVTNTQTKSVGISASKVWIVQDASGNTVGTYYVPKPNGGDALPSGFAATATANGTSLTWGETKTGFTAGQSVSIDEKDVAVPTGCTVTSKQVTKVNGTALQSPAPLAYAATLVTSPDPNTFEITNTVKCTQLLTLVKKVVNTHGGTSDVPDWTLTGTGPQTITGKTGDSTVTNAAVKPGPYALSESGPAGYAPSAWSCTGGTVTGASVDVVLGATVVCTITNSDRPGAVTWTKTDQATGLLGGSVWTLTGPGFPAPGASVTDCTASPCAAGPGLDQDPAAGKFSLTGLKWGDYTLVEKSAPLGYVVDLTVHTFSITAANAGTSIVAGAFKNTPVVPPTLPLTGGLGRDAFIIGGFGLLLIGLAVYAIRRFRSSKRSIS